MKKTYSKPQILFDSFELSQSIASCDQISNHIKGACGMELAEGITVFSAEKVCTVFTPPNTDYAGICYEIPLGAITLFSS